MALNWQGPQIVTAIERMLFARLMAATTYLKNSVREEISLPGTVSRIKFNVKVLKSGVVRIRRGRRHTVYGAVRSQPGEPPRKQYGTLRSRYAQEGDIRTLKSRVGANYKVAKWLELGTSKMKPRPHLRRTMLREYGKLSRIVKQGQMPTTAFQPSWK